jgi:hypothetical protein
MNHMTTVVSPDNLETLLIAAKVIERAVIKTMELSAILRPMSGLR